MIMRNSPGVRVRWWRSSKQIRRIARSASVIVKVKKSTLTSSFPVCVFAGLGTGDDVNTARAALEYFLQGFVSLVPEVNPIGRIGVVNQTQRYPVLRVLVLPRCGDLIPVWNSGRIFADIFSSDGHNATDYGPLIRR